MIAQTQIKLDQKKKNEMEKQTLVKPVLGKRKLFQCVNPKALNRVGKKLVR